MKLAILGTVGLPARYGGWETLSDNLVQYLDKQTEAEVFVTVYCTGHAYPERALEYRGAKLRYSRLKANGFQSIFYDAVTMFDAAFRGHDKLLLLGVSGAIVLPFLRLLTKAKIVTNVDGIEWRRSKWSPFAKWFLKFSEALAVRYSHALIADNEGISQYLCETYGIEPHVIAYGGDQALLPHVGPHELQSELPDEFALSLCRIEPENNIEMILEAFAEGSVPLVFVGNWGNSDFGRALKTRYADTQNLFLLDPVYDPANLIAIRQKASAYIHGHSVGGTNPSLVEMMHFGIQVFAFDCIFNRYTTENAASYFTTATQLRNSLSDTINQNNGQKMQSIANSKYRWDLVGQQYLSLLINLTPGKGGDD